MNVPDRSLSPDILDELISADLDGEFDRAATELGFDPESARAAMEDASGSASRRDALVAARAMLSTQPRLGAGREAELVASALSADDARNSAPPTPTPLRRHRARSAWRALAAVGAAAAVIAGILAVAATNPGGEAKSSSAGPALANEAAGTTRPPRRATGPVVAFGEVSQSETLRSKVRDHLTAIVNTPPPQSAKAASPSDSMLSGSSGADRYGAGNSNTDAAGRARRAALQTCITSIASSTHQRFAPVLSGTGTSGERPVFVVVFARPNTRLVYVLSAADCSVVTSTTVP